MKVIGQRERFGSHLGLERIQLLCGALGNPQDHLKCIHVAGTNGKGSVSAFLARVLAEGGYRVGLFTSPHLEHYSERFQINGSLIDKGSLEKFVAQGEEACLQVEQEHPQLGPVTEFELATAVSFLYFRESGVDVVVLETGLGGRLDATNVVHPVLTVITTIGHDHTDRLGTSLKEIAWEKGGIIKADVPVISGVEPGPAEAVLQEMASKLGAPWRSTYNLPWEDLGWNLSGGSLSFPGWGQIEVGLLGEHQIQNAATALLALQELAQLGWDLPVDAVQRGMAKVRWPGRLEVLSTDPFVILDGGHNQEGIAALVRSLRHLQAELGGENFTFVFGMLHNKSLQLLDPLFPLAKRFVFTTADSGRLAPMDPKLLVTYAQSHGVEAAAYSAIGQALQDAYATAPVCICGSLYLAGTVRRFLHAEGVIIG